MSDAIEPDVPAQLLAVLAPVVEDPATISDWFTAREPELDEESPASWLSSGREPDAVLEQARPERRAAADLAGQLPFC